MPTQKEIDAITKIVADKYDITDVTTEIIDHEALAKHYVGELIPVIIKGQQSSLNTKLHLIIKVTRPGEGDNEILISDQINMIFFATEISAYTKMLPAFKAFEQTMGIKDGFTLIECYHHSKEPKKEMLVLQDMRKQGYKVCTDTMFLDIDHVTVALKEVAKFHALSLALQQMKPDTFKELAENFTPIEDSPMFAMFSEILIDTVKRDTESLCDKYKSKLESCYSSLTQEALRNVSRVKVLCHTDLWRNNILFKYENSNPCSACLLDYQLVQLGSPAADLLSFIMACTDHKVRRHHYGFLINFYYQALTESLAAFSIDVAKVYSFEELNEDLKSIGPSCLLRSIFGLQTWFGIGGLNNIPQYKPDEMKAVEGTDTKLDVVEQCRQAAENLISDFVKYGYI